MSLLDTYFREIDRYHLLTREEEQTATPDELVEHNLRLVVNIARSYGNASLSLEDRISEGNHGLFIASRKFKPELGYKFSTYATWWIRQSISRAIQDNHTVRLPGPFLELLAKYHKLRYEYLSKHGRPPKSWEVRKHLNCTTRMYKEVLKAEKRTTTSFQELASSNHAQNGKPFDPADYRQGQDPLSLSMHAEMGEWLAELLRHLPPIQRAVIVRRFGIGCTPETMESIAVTIGRTRERVRQIEAAALKKLYKHAKRLRPFDDSYCAEDASCEANE